MPAESPPMMRAAIRTPASGAHAARQADRAEIEHGGGKAERVTDRNQVELGLRRVERLPD